MALASESIPTGSTSAAIRPARISRRCWRPRTGASAGCRPTSSGCALISGSYDLEPAVLSARSSYISLTKREKRELSPIHFADRLTCPVLVAFAEHDTDEFRRQSLAFAEAAQRAGKPCDMLCMPGLNHFTIVEQLAQNGSLLLSAILQRFSQSVC